MRLSIDARAVQGVTVLDLVGHLIVGPEAKELSDRVQRLVGDKKARIVLNVAKVSYVDSTGIGMLVSCFSLAKNAGGALKLANADDRFREILKITQLKRVLPLYGTEDEAVASFS